MHVPTSTPALLGFDLVQDQRAEPTPYVFVRRGLAAVGAVEAGHPVSPDRRAAPEGVEIVLEVDDVDVECSRIEETGWPIATGLHSQPWGLVDFRLHDPDGHYIRITSRSGV